MSAFGWLHGLGPMPRPARAAWRRWLPPGAAGRATLSAGAALVLAGVLSGVVASAWRGEAAALREGSAQRRAEALRLADLRLREPVNAAIAWPAATEDAARVRALIGLAQRHGVVVRVLRQERSAPRSAASTARWLAVAMTAEGDYGALRRFIEAALAADAALALDSLMLQRADAGSATLRAELAWALGSSAR